LIRIRAVRIAFFALLFANLVYFAWAHWIDVPRRPPASESVGRLPQLQLVDELPPSQRRHAGAPEKMALTTTTACLSVGPFADLANSAQAAALLEAKGFDPRQRAEQGQTSEGYWVYVGGLKSQAEAETALVALEHQGIRDTVVMPETADAGRRLSLGLYTERNRAERRAEAVRRAGLKAEVAERKLPSTLYWVDLSPPAGMNTVPLEDLFAEGVKSRIAVQPCPSPHAAHEVTATTASNPPPAVEAAPKLP
jgi:hypothetical protein